MLTKLLKCGYDEVKTIVDLGFIDCVKTILSFLSLGERDAINIFDALKSIVKTSQLLRDTVLQSGIVAKFSKCLELNSADVELSCVDMLKAMLCNKNMPPVEHINLHLGLPIGSGLLSLNDFEIVECIGLSLCCQIETKLAEEYRKSRVLPSILKLLTQPSAKVQASAIGLFSKYADLNPYTEVKSAFAIKCLEVLSQYLDNESDSVKRKACKSLGCVFDKWSQKPDDTSWESRKISHVALATKRQDIYLKWITTLSALLPTNSPSYVQKLMQYLPVQLQKRIDATDNAHRWLYQIDDAIKTMSYDELSKINLADDYLDDSLSLRVEHALMSDQYDNCKYQQMSTFVRALVSNNQQLLLDRPLRNELLLEIAAKLPCTMSELRKLILDQKKCDECGEGILNVIEACNDPKKYWCIVYQNGVFPILYSSAEELPTEY